MLDNSGSPHLLSESQVREARSETGASRRDIQIQQVIFNFKKKN